MARDDEGFRVQGLEHLCFDVEGLEHVWGVPGLELSSFKWQVPRIRVPQYRPQYTIVPLILGNHQVAYH